MKQTIISLGTVLLAAAFITACQKEDHAGDIAGSPREMNFSVLSPGAQTKVSGGAFEAGDRIGLFVTDYADEQTPMPIQISGNRATNVAATFDGQTWTSERPVYWGEGKSDVYATFPRIEDLSDINSQRFSVSTDQSVASKDGAPAAYESSDFLWAKAEGVSRTDGAVSLAMRHVMSRLVVRIVAGDKYVGSLPEDATVLLHSTVTDARIDLEKGSVEKDPYGGAKSIRMRSLGIISTGGVDAVTYEAIVVPQMLETSVPLIEINSKSVSYQLEDSFSFRPGVSYTYTATLNASTTAIRVDIGCEIDDWNSTGGSGSGTGGGTEPGGDDGDGDGTIYTDLSADGTANCYLITEAGNYKFRAVQGNTDGTVGNVKSVEVLWESFGTDVTPNIGDLIVSTSYKDGYIRFKTPEIFSQGNAVIAAKNSKGVILWSWHIWCSKEGWQEQVYYNNAGTMMDRNLGATSATPGDVGALGLLYQWGRKDPFLGSSSISESKAAASTGVWSSGYINASYTDADEQPMFFSYGFNSWGWRLTDGIKSPYDPCPNGWRIPDGDWARVCGVQDKYATEFDKNNMGFNFSGELGDDNVIWFPASGRIGYQFVLEQVGNIGQHHTYNDEFSCFYFDYNRNITENLSRGNSPGFAVRCQRI